MARQFSPQKLKLARKAKGIKVEQLALGIERSFHTAEGYERGLARPSADVLGKLADLLDVSIDDLFTEGEPADVA